MNRKEAREYVNAARLTDFMELEKSRKGSWCCPVCGSGKGANQSGALQVYDGRVMCFSAGCRLGADGRGEDNLGALRVIWDCGEDEVFERLGITVDRMGGSSAHTVRKVTRPQLEDRSDYLDKAHAELMESREALDYLRRRGIGDDAIERFNLGYDPSWTHPNTRAYPTKRIIVPRSSVTYMARAIDLNERWYNDAYKKQIVGTQKDLFNAEAMRDADIIVVVEGEFDAISIWQATGRAAVGLGSTSMVAAFAIRARDVAPRATYLIALDNDANQDGRNPGREAQDKLVGLLTDLGISAHGVDTSVLYGRYKDANETFVNNRNRLAAALEEQISVALGRRDESDYEKELEHYRRSGAGVVYDFLERAQTNTYRPIETGLTDVDEALCGGFVSKTLCMLAAAPGAGKTALVQQVFYNVAAQGRHVLFFNLEMGRDQLISRTLSRICRERGDDLSTLEMMRGYDWTDAQREAATEAADEYVRTVGERLVYNPEGTSARLDSILEEMEAEANRLEAAGRGAPIVVLDYLQLVRGREREDDVAAMKRAAKSLKDYAVAHDTIVFCIIATNRESNRTGQVHQWSGRDTSALEYSADLMLSLTYTAIEEGVTVSVGGKRQAASIQLIEQLRKQAYASSEDRLPSVCTDLTLKVLKNRFGEAGRYARLEFDGRHARFTEAGIGALDD